jgi:hypothetical protein
MKLSEIRAGRPAATKTRPALAGVERVLHLSYTTADGTRQQATLTARLLDTSARIGRDVACARLAAPLSFDDLATAAQLRLWVLTTLAHALDDAPAWLEQALEYDEALAFRLYEEVAAHERAYFLADVGEGEEEARGARVELRAIDTPAPG